MSARYAIYLAPAPDSALWRFGSRVLGRDAATGADMAGYAPPGYSPGAWRENTQTARRYGFHATLKAPFRLREGRTVGELETAIAAIAQSNEAFDLGALGVTKVSFGGGAFVALTPAAASPKLAELEAQTVRGLDPFRAALSEAEIATRRPERLSARQREYLSLWGYPYVLDEFRLHFTLSGRVEAPDALADALALERRRSGVPAAFRVDALTLFAQNEAQPFLVLKRFKMASQG